MSRDSQHAGRIVHVCPDQAVGGRVAAAAARHGLTCRRFDNAFAAALELLASPAEGTILLIALDCLARPEIPLLAWASHRWPDMPIWGHGLPARLNGHLADARVKLIAVEQLDGLLAASRPVAGAMAVTAASSQPCSSTPSSQTCLRQTAVAGMPPNDGSGTDTSPDTHASDIAAGQDATPANASDDDAGCSQEQAVDDEHADDALCQPEQRDQSPASAAGPALRLHAPPADAGPLLTTEELAVLLGPEDAGGN